jgi:tRNA dimethylallyltransferase
MDIGTAKPDAETRLQVPHHLIDIIDPTQRYSAAQFQADALSAMHAAVARGKLPLLVGGTMLYFKALRDGLSSLPAASEQTRRSIDAMAVDAGWPALHRELARVDPSTARRLDPNDSQRIQRALEVFYITGRPMAELIAAGNSTPLPFRLVQIALNPADRTVLHRRIAERFESMLELGLIDEVRQLRQKYCLNAELPSMRCVGYRQAWQHLEGEYDLATMRDKAIAATRQLAKRQLTWLRATENVCEFDCLSPNLEHQVETWLSTQLKQ